MSLTFLYFGLIKSKFLYLQQEARCSEDDQVYTLYIANPLEVLYTYTYNFDLVHTSICIVVIWMITVLTWYNIYCVACSRRSGWTYNESSHEAKSAPERKNSLEAFVHPALHAVGIQSHVDIPTSPMIDVG